MERAKTITITGYNPNKKQKKQKKTIISARPEYRELDAILGPPKGLSRHCLKSRYEHYNSGSIHSMEEH